MSVVRPALVERGRLDIVSPSLSLFAFEQLRKELPALEELTGYLENMLKGTQKCVSDAVVCDSEAERKLAQEMEDELP